MAEFKVDSWNQAQLARLRDFFTTYAKNGDIVIFDRKLAEDNAPSLEGLDDDMCNSFVYRAANMALEGLNIDDVKRISTEIKLTTRYLHGIPDTAQKQNQHSIQEEADDDCNVALDLLEEISVPAIQPINDDAAAEWAATLAKYHNRHQEPEPEIN